MPKYFVGQLATIAIFHLKSTLLLVNQWLTAWLKFTCFHPTSSWASDASSPSALVSVFWSSHGIVLFPLDLWWWRSACGARRKNLPKVCVVVVVVVASASWVDFPRRVGPCLDGELELALKRGEIGINKGKVDILEKVSLLVVGFFNYLGYLKINRGRHRHSRSVATKVHLRYHWPLLQIWHPLIHPL